MEFLRFVYFDCYGDLYPITDPRFAAHHAHMKEKLLAYERVLPHEIAAL